MSKVFAGYHIVFATKYRQRTINTEELREKLYAYIFGFLQNKKCYVFRIGGMSDHVHMALDLNPQIALADLVRDMKRSSGIFMSAANGFVDFMGWGDGYYAGTFSYENRDRVIGYIKNQQSHHQGKALDEELEWLALKMGLQYHTEDCK